MNTSRLKQMPSTSLRQRALSAGVAAAMAGLLSFTVTGHAQENAPAPHAQHFQHGAMDPAKAAKRFDHMLKRLVPDASPEQKVKLNAIAKAAFDDLRPLREQSRAAHAESIKLLAQPTIDRAALERARQTEQQLADQRSRRVTQALADAADVLTPAQRVKAAEKLAKHHSHRHHGFHHGADKDAVK